MTAEHQNEIDQRVRTLLTDPAEVKRKLSPDKWRRAAHRALLHPARRSPLDPILTDLRSDVPYDAMLWQCHQCDTEPGDQELRAIQLRAECAEAHILFKTAEADVAQFLKEKRKTQSQFLNKTGNMIRKRGGTPEDRCGSWRHCERSIDRSRISRQGRLS